MDPDEKLVQDKKEEPQRENTGESDDDVTTAKEVKDQGEIDNADNIEIKENGNKLNEDDAVNEETEVRRSEMYEINQSESSHEPQATESDQSQLVKNNSMQGNEDQSSAMSHEEKPESPNQEEDNNAAEFWENTTDVSDNDVVENREINNNIDTDTPSPTELIQSIDSNELNQMLPLEQFGFSESEESEHDSGLTVSQVTEQITRAMLSMQASEGSDVQSKSVAEQTEDVPSSQEIAVSPILHHDEGGDTSKDNMMPPDGSESADTKPSLLADTGQFDEGGATVKDISNSTKEQELRNSTKLEQERTEFIEQERKDGNGKTLNTDDEVDEEDEDDDDTVAGDTDTSQFAQLIVQHVLSHAVSSFNESDHEQDTMDEGSVSSFPADDLQINRPLEWSVSSLGDFTYKRVKESLKATNGMDLGDVDINEEGDQSPPRGPSPGNTEEEPQHRNEVDNEISNDNDAISKIPDADLSGTQQESETHVNELQSDERRERTPSIHSTCDPSCGLPKLAPLAAYPDFPENYGNYKVCRDIGPGMKECLILETGENVKSNDTKTKDYSVPEWQESISDNQSDKKRDTSERSKAVTPPPPSDDMPGSVQSSPASSHSSDSSRRRSFRIVKGPDKSSTAHAPPCYDEQVKYVQKTILDERNEPVRQYQDIDVVINSNTVRHSNGEQAQDTGSRINSGNNDQSLDGNHIDYRTGHREERTVRSAPDSNRVQQQQDINKHHAPPSAHYSSSAVEMMERIDPRILQSSTGYIPRDNDMLESTSCHLPVLSEPFPYQNISGEPVHLSDHMQNRQDMHSRVPVTVGGETYDLNLSDPQVYKRYQRNLLSREYQMDNGPYYPASHQVPSNYPYSLPTESSGIAEAVSHRVGYSVPQDFERTNSNFPEYSAPLSTDRTRDTIDGSFVTLMPEQATEDLTEVEKEYLAQLYNRYSTDHHQSLLSQYDISASYGSTFHDGSADVSVPSSGPVPEFKTLQEQQTSWMHMFETLEEKHQEELKQQFRQHQHNIFNMQHQMEKELYNQQQELKRKLKAHKQVLETSQNMSLNSSSVVSPSQSRSSRSMDRASSGQHEVDGQSMHRSPAHGRDTSPSWRDIYKEVRKEMDFSNEDDSRHASESVRRSLEKDFTRSPTQTRSRSVISPTKSSGSPQSRTRSHSSPPRSSGSPSRGPHSRSLSDNRVEGDGLPRAGVYSSPMPILRGKTTNVKETVPLEQSGSPSHSRARERVVSPSPSEIRQSANLHKELEDRHQELVRQQRGLEQELITKPELVDDVHLSSSMRVTLREKHAKHMADLREYYERELYAMRQAFTESSQFRGQGSLTEIQNLQLENKLLKEKANDLEESLDVSHRRNRELEQRLQGLEVRASDYADYYKEAQEKIGAFRRTVEELQYNSREKDDFIEHLQIEYKTQGEALKKSRQIQDEQARHIHSDRSSLQKLADKYEANKRECNNLKESVANLENKLYDSREEIVALKRSISRMELENKRLSRENDNLHHKVTNLSSLHNSFNESFGGHAPSAVIESPRQQLPQQHNSHDISGVHDISHRQLEDPVRGRVASPHRGLSSHRSVSPQNTSVRNMSPRVRSGDTPSHDTHEMNGSLHSANDSVRIRTPNRNVKSPQPAPRDLPNSKEIDTSPIMRAEEELYKLRDVLRGTPPICTEPVQPKIQKKFYGTDIVSPSRRSERSPDRALESPKSRKKYNNLSSNSSKSRSKDLEYKNTPRTKPSKRSQPSPRKEQSSQTRFDVGVQDRSRSVEDQKSESPGRLRQPGDGAVLDTNGVAWTPSKRGKSGEEGRRKNRREVIDPSETSVDRTLQKVRAGQYVSRPLWEDIYTTMATTGAPIPNQPVSKETRIKEKLKTIGDMEHRYDDLNMEKRKLESALSRLPSHGKSRREKEQVEDHLDKVERELGSIRMSLKRYNVLKTSI